MQRVLFSIALGVFLCLALGTFLGCSPQRKYEVLSFFFDGVPAPAGTKGVAGSEAPPVHYVHKPFGEAKCGSCHGSDQIEMGISAPTDIKEIPSSICLNCHQKVLGEYRVMHGPVVAVQCMACHAPHDSAVEHLLKAPAPPICAQCHTPELMLPALPEHRDAKADCLSCHFGHGGPEHKLLRPSDMATTRPAMKPAVSSIPATPKGAGL